ncbi:twin-arginine translocation signal domain-containing protein [Faecalibacterium wellingii]|uniref:Twin-arginine translocation signal domain-containing protein n=1 Tax=Faecalibacterium wellingii TaxID=2929491 RepID=A0ABU3TW95_9FIRM|nr:MULTISPECIES: twin-arginine translocation signal domain-containing protein [Faecalibacterium]MDU8687516.1 twin-arginine translocation signal domain-containing protein [Faecalibacterium prausnitzii]UQK57362.1 twin-arginine translocation signal domain-containing protein [Faecalibacterium sp. HTF-F]
MNISRRSFLKLAALSTAAVAVSASMTGCATVFTPNLTIVYQEEKTGEIYAFTGTEANVKAGGKMWENGKKTVQSKEQFFLDLLKDVEGWSESEEVTKKITAELAKDYKMDGKMVTDVEPTVKSTATAHTITFTFKVKENA